MLNFSNNLSIRQNSTRFTSSRSQFTTFVKKATHNCVKNNKKRIQIRYEKTLKNQRTTDHPSRKRPNPYNSIPEKSLYRSNSHMCREKQHESNKPFTSPYRKGLLYCFIARKPIYSCHNQGHVGNEKGVRQEAIEGDIKWFQRVQEDEEGGCGYRYQEE